jgi:group I intron endonuclease
MIDDIICGIYVIENIINNKLYIGQAKDINDRWKTHIWKLNNNRHYNRYLQNAWNKYGESCFKFTIIRECDESELNVLEIYYIDEYKSFCKENGYNLTYGGEGTSGHTLSEETKIRIGSFHKGKEISQKQRDSLREQFTGEGNPFYGKEHSEETKRKISEARKVNGNSKGGKNIKAKKVICDYITYDCAGDCADFYNIKSSTLRSWLRGNRKMPIEFQNLNLSYV